MIFYVTCAMLGFIFYPFFYRFDKEPLGEVNYREKKMYFVLITIVLVFVAGFRKRNIGIDTTAYYQMFLSYKNITWSRFSLEILDEPGYKILNWTLANIVQSDFQLLLILEAVIAIVPVSILIYRHSDNPGISFFFYLAFGFFTFALSGIRQSIAIGFTIIAFMQIPKKKPLLYALFVFLAMLFHQTAIITIPMYFLRRFKINVKNALLFLVLGIGMYLFRSPIITFLLEHSNNYYYAMETGGDRQLLFIVLMIITALFMIKELEQTNSINSLCFCMLATTAMILPVLKYHPVLHRLFYYFYIYVIIFIPNQIKSIKTQAVRTGFTVAYMFVGLYFFATQVLFPDLKIIEYEFFWQ